MIADNLEFVHFAATALILIFLIARIGKRNHRGFFKSLVAGGVFSNDCAADRMFEEHHIAALKTCPNCAEQLPVSGLVCDACDYNFLSGMVGSGKKLLASPQTPVRMMPKQRLAYRS